MCKIISVISCKGGVGKTTSTVNISSYMQMHGKRVCVVDLDPQHNLSKHFGIHPGQIASQPTIYDLFNAAINETEQIVGSTDAYSEKIATTNEPTITEAVTGTDVPNNSIESTSSEITATQKPVVPSPPLPVPVPDTTTAATTAEASTVTEPDPVPQMSVEDIIKICVCIAEDMGYSHNTTFTPENAVWWNPVTISLKDSKQSIERTLSEYIRFHTLDNLAAYGYDKITCFNIYAEKLEEDTYRIYFLFA